jgi:hypothetical protein
MVRDAIVGIVVFVVREEEDVRGDGLAPCQDVAA